MHSSIKKVGYKFLTEAQRHLLEAATEKESQLGPVMVRWCPTSTLLGVAIEATPGWMNVYVDEAHPNNGWECEKGFDAYVADRAFAYVEARLQIAVGMAVWASSDPYEIGYDEDDYASFYLVPLTPERLLRVSVETRNKFLNERGIGIGINLDRYWAKQVMKWEDEQVESLLNVA